MQADFIDRIYEAAALPELWPDVFHDLATANGFAGGGVITVNERFARGVVSPGVKDLFDEYAAKGWAVRNGRVARAAALKHHGFLRDRDFMSEEEIEADPMHNELLRPRGFGRGVGSVVDSPNGDSVVLIFERLYALGPVDPATLPKLDLARPHLARAALLSGRLELERLRAQVDALSGLGVPAAVLTDDGRAMAANHEFEALSAQVAIGARDAVTLVDPSSDALFRAAISRQTGVPPVGRSIPLKATGDAPAAVFHVLPVRRAARDVFTRATWLIAIAALRKAKVEDPTILSGLYDLTPSEARVAGKIIEGETVADIASALALTEATIRTQLRGVFAKTGTSRQGELVSLCGGLAWPRRS
ncbi:helix-turn-helix transcriptional regulator [Methylopila sp. M107]|uniref:helix-turn-helix transcriptional regulator n=1 Tax=Methylopila sp. M107 TaxID=1101190 RepID=UPI00036BFEA5|nr:helix-turn-helix transcriptional regulator [Methylopila sp. M107]